LPENRCGFWGDFRNRNGGRWCRSDDRRLLRQFGKGALRDGDSEKNVSNDSDSNKNNYISLIITERNASTCG
jgi:hypothetical protein